QVSSARQRQRSIKCQEVAALAERTNEIDQGALALALDKDGDRVLGAVQGRAEQVVAAAVADGDRPPARALHVQDAGHERAGGADEMAAGLQNERRLDA